MLYSQLHHSISCVGEKKEVTLIREVVCESFHSSHMGIPGGEIESGKKYHKTHLNNATFSTAADWL